MADPDHRKCFRSADSRRRRRSATDETWLIWINSGSRRLREDFADQRSIAMPRETAVMLFAIVIPFAIFAGVLGWAQSRARWTAPGSGRCACRVADLDQCGIAAFVAS